MAAQNLFGFEFSFLQIYIRKPAVMLGGWDGSHGPTISGKNFSSTYLPTHEGLLLVEHKKTLDPDGPNPRLPLLYSVYLRLFQLPRF